MRRSRRPVLVLLTALAMLVLGASSAQAFPQAGISQSFRDFGLNFSKGPGYDPNRDVSRSVYWSPLGINKYRVIIPWDIADRAPSDERRREFENWLRRLREISPSSEPFVVFGPTERQYSTDTAHSPPHFSNVPTRRLNPYYNSSTEPQPLSLVVPPVGVYRTAIDDFLATWGPGSAARTGLAEVRTIGAWNEPNVPDVGMSLPGSIPSGGGVPNPRVFLPNSNTQMYETLGVCPSGSSTESNCGPLAAAYYWNNARAAMAARCSNCTVVAGEFDSDGLTNGPRFWALYKEKINLLGSARPQVISFHGHHDVAALGTNGSSDCTPSALNKCITYNFTQWLQGLTTDWSLIPVWDTEVGAQHASGTSPSSEDTAQKNRFNNLISMEETYGVSRFYYYNFQHQSGSNDRSLIDSAGNGTNPDGVNARQRPIWDVIRCAGATSCPAWSLPKPEATTQPATDVTWTGATVKGLVLPNGRNTTWVFHYGRTTGYGSATTAYAGTVNSSATTPQAVSAPISGLAPGVTYHYRLVAVNATGTTYGPDQTFKTKELDLRPSFATRDQIGGTRWVYFATQAMNLGLYGVTSQGVGRYNLGNSLRSGASPSVVRNPYSADQWVYYPNSAGGIGLTAWTASSSTWSSYDMGRSVRTGTNLAAVRNPNTGEQAIYYVKPSGALAQLAWDPGTSTWKDRELGGSVIAGGSPTVEIDPETGTEWVYFISSSGALSQFQGHNDTWSFSSIGGSGRGTPTASRDPETGKRWVYFANTSGGLSHYHWNGSAWVYYDIGGTLRADSSPVLLRNPSTFEQWIYYINQNGELALRYWSGSAWSVQYDLSDPAAAGATVTAMRDPVSGAQWIYFRYSNENSKFWQREWTGWSWVPNLLEEVPPAD